jgi:tetratricopeptide (TPR) repeat protein
MSAAARHRAAVASACGVLLVGAAAAVAGLLWHNERLRTEADKTAAEAEKAVQEREAALKARRSTRRAAEKLYTKVAEKWLKGEPGAEKAQREFLEEALRFYEELTQEPEDDSAAQQELANAYRRMGEIHLRLGRPAEAERALGKAAGIAEKLAAQHPDHVDYQSDLSSIYYPELEIGNGASTASG